jgi:sulfide:quinone oxidoreductase
MLRKELKESEWQITIIDRDERHHYQAGYLFIPFGVYGEQDVLKPKKEFIPQDVDFVIDKVVKIDAAQRRVETLKGQYDYDWLVIATGCDIQPSEINGMLDGWRKDTFDFYTLEGALALRKHLKYFSSGKVVLNIAEFPYKCPIAPLEFVFMADWFFTVNGVRDKVEIEFVTPLDNVFTKPVAAKTLAVVAAKKNIKVTPYFDLAQVNAGEKTIESHKGQKVAYDLLVAIPPNMGAKALIDSEVSDPVGFVPTDKHTLKASKFDRIYVTAGDTTNVPTSKAGSVAHYMAYTLVENLVREIDGHPPLPKFDGHATCFLASGFEKAILLDFNYAVTTEQMILDRLDRLETQIAPLTASARDLGELREELAPRVNEAVQALIVELADVEADFQLEDLLFLIKKMMRNIRNLDFALDQMKNLIDFALTAEPLLKSSVPQVISFLDDLEQRGVLRLLRTGMEVLKKVGASYSAEELQQTADGMVRLAGILKKLTAPEALDLLERAAELPSRVNVAGASAIGPWGMLRGMGDPQVQQGLGVLLELTKGLAEKKSCST